VGGRTGEEERLDVKLPRIVERKRVGISSNYEAESVSTRSKCLGIEVGTAAHPGRRFQRESMALGVRSSEVAHPTRFERVASTFGGWRSIQLSYGCISISPSPTDL
jgi:hypothetical protein